MNCIVCGSPCKLGLSSWHLACAQCGYEAASLAPRINQADAHALVDEPLREASLRALREHNFCRIVERLRELAPQGRPRLLEVGCAHGWFLEHARTHFEVLGIEPDMAILSRIAAAGLPVRHGYFPEALLPTERFELIVFNDVIEHIPGIGAALQACHDTLVPGGLLLLNLPSSKGFFYRLSKLLVRLHWRAPFERMWQKDLPSPHVHYFDPRNLQALALQHGLDRIDSFNLPSLRARGLLARLKMVGKTSALTLYPQYLALLGAVPVLGLMPSDIMVCVFRRRSVT